MTRNKYQRIKMYGLCWFLVSYQATFDSCSSLAKLPLMICDDDLICSRGLFSTIPSRYVVRLTTCLISIEMTPEQDENQEVQGQNS